MRAGWGRRWGTPSPQTCPPQIPRRRAPAPTGAPAAAGTFCEIRHILRWGGAAREGGRARCQRRRARSAADPERCHGPSQSPDLSGCAISTSSMHCASGFSDPSMATPATATAPGLCLQETKRKIRRGCGWHQQPAAPYERGDHAVWRQRVCGRAHLPLARRRTWGWKLGGSCKASSQREVAPAAAAAALVARSWSHATCRACNGVASRPACILWEWPCSPHDSGPTPSQRRPAHVHTGLLRVGEQLPRASPPDECKQSTPHLHF